MGTLSLRILKIPRATTKESLCKLLDGLTVNSSNSKEDAKCHHTDNIHAISLAPSPLSIDSDRYQVATVTFKSLPVELEGCASRSECLIISMGTGDEAFEAQFDPAFEGLTPLNYPSNPSVDIIAVTGLAGHAFGSWKSPKGPEMWLRDFLPDDLASAGCHARVLTYGYDTKLVGSTSNASIRDLSKQFLQLLKRSSPAHYLIGHSLGGLVIKQALRQADCQIKDVQNKDILESCHGILLFGVPNRGLENTQLIPMVKGQPNSRLIEDLGSRSQFLDLLDQEFCRYFRFKDTKIVSFYELNHTRTVQKNPRTNVWEKTGKPVLIVSPESAVHKIANDGFDDGIPIDADHSTMVKFRSQSEKNYSIVRDKIFQLAQTTPQNINTRLSVCIRGKRTKEETECLRSLVPDDNDPTLKRPRAKQVHPGTCTWLLRNEKFENWRLSSKSKPLWISGLPGTGKTVLASYTLGVLERHSRVIYFFCDDKDECQRTAIAVLKSLIFQLLLQNISMFKHIIKYFELFQHGEKPAWSFDTLWQIFSNIAQDIALGPVYCLLDALDGCQADEGTFSALIFLCSLQVFDTVLLGRGQRATENDISKFIGEKLQQEFSGRFSPEVVKETAEYLENEAGGMFIWVSLVIKDLNCCFSDAEIGARLSSLPKGLYPYYDSILGRIQPEHQQRAKQMLMWIVHAARPMTLEELNIALAIASSPETPTSMESIKRYLSNNLKRELEMRCGLLVEFREHSTKGEYTVHLVHQSVKDFFIARPEVMDESRRSGFSATHRSNFYITPQSANSSLGESCLIYLLFNDLKNLMDSGGWDYWNNFTWTLRNSDNLTHLLLGYSVHHWPYHLQRSTTLSPTTRNIFTKFYGSHSESFQLWVDMYRAVNTDIQDTGIFSPLHAGSLFGLSSLVSFLLEVSRDPSQQDPSRDPWTPLHYAVVGGSRRQGHRANTATEIEATVRQLVEGGADVNHVISGISPFHGAVAEGSLNIVKFLVESGADLRSPDCYERTPLHIAAETTEEIVRFLVERGVDVNSRGHSGYTALHSAVRRVTRGAVRKATREATQNIVKFLVESGADVNLKCDNGDTPLFLAAGSDSEETVRFLIESGAHIDMQKLLFSAIHEPLPGSPNEDVLRFLLKDGPDVNFRIAGGSTLLHRAVMFGNDVAVRMLVESKANLNLLCAKGKTSLYLAATSCWGYGMGNIRKFQIIRFLVGRGADLNKKSKKGRVPLHAFLTRSYTMQDKEMIQFLVESGADADTKNEDGETALSLAVRMLDEEVVRIMIRNGADVNTKNARGSTPLHRAASGLREITFFGIIYHGLEGRRKKITQLREGMDMRKDARGKIMLLVEAGANINMKDARGETALWVVAEKGHIDILRYLIEHGADVNTRNRGGRTILSWAASHGHGEIVKLLVENGAVYEKDVGEDTSVDSAHGTRMGYLLGGIQVKCYKRLLIRKACMVGPEWDKYWEDIRSPDRLSRNQSSSRL